MAKVVAAVSIGDKQRFEQLLTKALKSRGNLLILAHCAAQLQLKVVEVRAKSLAGEEAVITDIERGRALWDLLRETIERLRPSFTEPQSSPAWRLYTIAEGVYLQGKSAKTMAKELGFSPRTFYRARRTAVEAVVTVVGQVEGAGRRQRIGNGTD